MKFLRHTHFAVGAAGLFTGLVYHKLANNRQFLVSADKVTLDIDGIISQDVKEYVNQYAPIMKYGFPSYDTLRIKDGFILSYDRRNKVANWVMEHLTSYEVKKEDRATRKCCKFFEDVTIHTYFRATKDDYLNSGYDKGHLAAAGNYAHSQRTMDNTFVMSNISPQNEYFNQGIWERLERHVRDLVNKYGSVYVCTGPLYMPRTLELEDEHLSRQQKRRKRKGQKQTTSQTKGNRKYVIYEVIGENDVAVPTHFFKIIVCEADENTYDLEAYIIPNEQLNPCEKFTDFKVPRNTIERAAGFLLFDQLPTSTFRYINGEESKPELPMEL